MGCCVSKTEENDEVSEENLKSITPYPVSISPNSEVNWRDIQFKGKSDVITAKCVDVYDGDTCKVMIKKVDFFNNIQGEYIVINIRMVGINSAEIRTKNLIEKQRGLECKKHLEEKILGKEIKIKCEGHDKYGGRFLGIILPRQYDEKTVTTSLFESSINNEMLKEGYAVLYSGSGNKDWN